MRIIFSNKTCRLSSAHFSFVASNDLQLMRYPNIIFMYELKWCDRVGVVSSIFSLVCKITQHTSLQPFLLNSCTRLITILEDLFTEYHTIGKTYNTILKRINTMLRCGTTTSLDFIANPNKW